MGRYYGSEALRNPKLQKKAIDYALDQLNLMIQNVGSADRLAQLVEHRTTVREVAGSNPGRTTTQGL